jgi:hypothetical protein
MYLVMSFDGVHVWRDEYSTVIEAQQRVTFMRKYGCAVTVLMSGEES